MWIFNYAKKTNTDVPDLEGLSYLLHRVNRAMKIMYPDDVKLSDENLQSAAYSGMPLPLAGILLRAKVL